MRDFFIVSHHGQRVNFPENTIESYACALDLGANGIEVDICLTSDGKLVAFHDTSPLSETSILRPVEENIPIWLLSPKFLPTKLNPHEVSISMVVNGEYREVERCPLSSRSEFDIINLSLEDVRRYYHYDYLAGGKECIIPTLDEVLAWGATQTSRLKFVFIDVKNPNWDANEDSQKFVDYGTAIGKVLKSCAALPEEVFICNPDPKALDCLKKGIALIAQGSWQYAFDAQGSFGAMLGVKEDPLAIARMMGNAGVSIGASFREGSLDEIQAAVNDRDYNPGSTIETVIYWVLNDEKDCFNAFGAGVNAILTDKPDMLSGILRRINVVA